MSSYSMLSSILLLLLRRLPLEVLSNSNFWLDVCRSRDGVVFFYHSQNTLQAVSSRKEGLPEHTGRLNKAMNAAISSMCKEFPLALVAYRKNFMTSGGAGDLFNLKPRIIRCMAEQIVRY